LIRAAFARGELSYHIEHTRPGTLLFRRPDGQPIPPIPRPPRGDHHTPVAMTRHLTATPTPDACTPHWDGTPRAPDCFPSTPGSDVATAFR
jgi:hypothetical protein